MKENNCYICTLLSEELGFGEAFSRLVDLSTKNPESDYGIHLPHWSDDVMIKVQQPYVPCSQVGADSTGSNRTGSNKTAMTAPYLYVHSRYGNVPWKETNIEMFSTRWELYVLHSEIDGASPDPANQKSRYVYQGQYQTEI